MKQQPPSLSYREPPPPTRRANEHRHKGVECTCGWPLVIFIGRVYRRAYRGEKKGRGKRKKKEKEGKKGREKTLGRLIFFPCPDFTGDEQISPLEGRATPLFSAFSPLSPSFPTIGVTRIGIDLCLSSTCFSSNVNACNSHLPVLILLRPIKTPLTQSNLSSNLNLHFLESIFTTRRADYRYTTQRRKRFFHSRRIGFSLYPGREG